MIRGLRAGLYFRHSGAPGLGEPPFSDLHKT
jgi:hypothetical protein